jgi:hypothetical protein
MDSLITAAARALAAGDPIAALNLVALRDDAPALALRGIAMARLGDSLGTNGSAGDHEVRLLVRATVLLRSAARAFGPKEAVARARCCCRVRDCAGLARSRLAREGAGRGAGDA